MESLLFLSHRIPYPPNKGDKIRSFHLLKHLSERYRIYLGTFIDDARDWRYWPDVEALCAEAFAASLSPAWARMRSLPGLFNGTPLTLPYYRDAALQAWVNGILQTSQVERVLVFSSAMAQYVSHGADGRRRVIDFVDMDSDKWRQYAASRRWPMGWVYGREAATLGRYEADLASRFDASVFVSPQEAALFQRHAPEAAERVTYVHNGVDTDYFDPAGAYANPYPADRRVLVFTGAMDYWANGEAVSWFVREVWPQVRAQLPEAAFYIVGARPTSTVRQLETAPGVTVTGAVEDIRPYVAHARAAVAPLRIARGVQNKVLEAMAMARPVLVTPQALDGIQADPVAEVWCAEGTEALSRAAVALLQGERAELGDAARACVLRHYRWQENIARVEALLEGTPVQEVGP